MNNTTKHMKTSWFPRIIREFEDDLDDKPMVYLNKFGA